MVFAVCTCVVGVLLCSLGCASCLYQGDGAGVSGDCVVWYVYGGCGKLVCDPGCLCVVRVVSVGSCLCRTGHTHLDVPEGEHGHHHCGRGPALATEAAEHEAGARVLGEGSPQSLEQSVKILGGGTGV